MGKYLRKEEKQSRGAPFWMVPASFLLIEVFAFFFLSLNGDGFSWEQLWPLAFGLLWSGILGGTLRVLPRKFARIGYGVLYLLCLVYAGFQTGYFIMFEQMMWITEFLYAAEGSDYASVLLSYPVFWWIGILALIGLGVLLVWKYPRYTPSPVKRVGAAVLAAACWAGAIFLPELVFLADSGIRYASSDYGRMQSAEAAYDNMFNPHRLYQVCGVYQTAAKDLYNNVIYPITPAYALAQREAEETIETYFEEREESGDNAMTGSLKGKNVILVLMESMDDWMIGDHTPTIRKLMDEGINFTNFYTPGYGGIRTFNTEFCVNTGSFLSSQGGYAFDYVTNDYGQSLASQLTEEGYDAKVFHYNDPNFYSRGVYSLSMGYDEYVYYRDYVEEHDEKTQEQLLYDEQLLFDNPELRDEFFRQEEKTLNFVITRSAHLSYKYNEVLSYWALKQYPEYRGLTGNEETDCALLKAKLVDDLFARLLEELEAEGKLENTVIIGVTDHYTYGYKDMESLYDLSGTEEDLLLEKTPCFIWSPGLDAMEVEKTLNTADFLPTVLNLLDVQTEDDYIGRDAFDESYEGFVPFSDGSWISGDIAYDAGEGEVLLLEEDAKVEETFLVEMAEEVSEFVYINNLILETDYYEE